MKRYHSIHFPTWVSYLTAALLLSAACSQEGPAVQQPEAAEIPMYTQLLLKGNVRSVRDSIVVRDHPELTDIIDMAFDEDRNLISYSVNGESYETDPAPSHPQYEHTKTIYAFFVYPDIWQNTDSMCDYGIGISEGEETTDTLSIHTSWDKNGLFTEVRCFFNGEPAYINHIMEDDGEIVPFQDKDAGIEKYLYDAKRYPRRCFYFEYDGSVELDKYFRFEEPDSHDNPLFIKAVISSTWAFSIFREITYY